MTEEDFGLVGTELAEITKQYVSKQFKRLEDRIAALEARPAMKFVGAYRKGTQYEAGHLVQWGGHVWHCDHATSVEPGESGEGVKSWTLMVRRGRDAR